MMWNRSEMFRFNTHCCFLEAMLLKMFLEENTFKYFIIYFILYRAERPFCCCSVFKRLYSISLVDFYAGIAIVVICKTKKHFA